MPHLEGVQHLIIGPERGIALVPFAAVAMPDRRYLIERFLLTYVGSGNDLILRHTGSVRQPPVLFGAPAFDHAPNSKDDEWDIDSIQRTRSEVISVRAKLGAAAVYTGRAASKTRLRTVHGPRILHLATHATSGSGADENGSEPDEEDERHLAAEILGIDRSIRLAPERPEEHLLRPKIALAGANADPAKGVMNAAELAHIDLHGTEIAVLSACPTGLGVIRNDEGVYSLRRALAVAGSRTQVTTMWLVDDAATEKLIVAFYGQLVPTCRNKRSEK